MRRLIERYRFPESYLKYSFDVNPAQRPGFFSLGEGVVCFGLCSAGTSAAPAGDNLCDARGKIRFEADGARLPFDPDEVVENLLLERYRNGASDTSTLNPLAKLYYGLRPLLTVSVRKHLQRFALRGWRKIPFPRWPVDVTVECFFEECVKILMKAQGFKALPFIWFWPDGYESCAIVTHDVETEKGRNFCSTLMDIDDSFGVKSSFTIVPESRYAVSSEFLEGLRKRGFEINVHDLNHDGHLFRNRETFNRRVSAINRYGKQFRTAGFRAGAMYRNQEWYGSLEFEYDMSVPTVAHMEAQRGGCCTVFPYSVHNVLEIPLTVTQDYALFHFLRDYSLNLWEHQIGLIRKKHGLINVLVHPDYIIERREQDTYLQLLHYLNKLRSANNAWIPTPGQLNQWWRARSAMTLVRHESEWRVRGPGSERASVAYARLDGDKLTYEIRWSKQRQATTLPLSPPIS
jgi:hypothetical protein